MIRKFGIGYYENENGKIPFLDWFEDLDYQIRARVEKRLKIYEQTGHLGDYKNLGDGIYEMRLFFGSGYRIYFTKQDDKIIIILCGGDKSTQTRDIEKAKKYWKDFTNKNYN